MAGFGVGRELANRRLKMGSNGNRMKGPGVEGENGVRRWKMGMHSVSGGEALEFS